ERDMAIRKRYVLKKDIEKNGQTPGCPGCISSMAGGSARAVQSQECRDQPSAGSAEGGARQRRMTRSPWERANKSRVRREDESDQFSHEPLRRQVQATWGAWQGQRRQLAATWIWAPSTHAVKDQKYQEILALVGATDLLGDNGMTHDELKEAAKTLTEMDGVDLAEIYSPERFKQRALGLGLKARPAADITSGRDLLDERQRRECMDQFDWQDPLLTTASPPGYIFCLLRALSNNKRDPEVATQEILEGETHLESSMQVCERRYRRGALFLHEHPWTAAPWDRPCVQRVCALPGVYAMRGPMCPWGPQPHRPDGRVAFVRKEIGWMAKSRILAEILEGECQCPWEGGEPRRHPRLIGDKRARAAQKHPKQLAKAILKELREELRPRETLSGLAGFTVRPSPREEGIDREAEARADDVRDSFLDPQRAREARREELEWRGNRDVWAKVPRREMELEGGRPIDARWIDTNNGDQDLFSRATPLEALKPPVSLFASRTHEQHRSASPREVGHTFYDVSQAYFYGTAPRRSWVELPPEEREGEVEPMAGLLNRTMHGTVDASQVWQGDYMELLKDKEFEQGWSSPAILRHPEHDVALEGHGDDFGVLIFAGDEEWFDELLTKYDYKVTGQTNVALPSGDSEHCAMLKGATHALGLQSMLCDFSVMHLFPIMLTLALVELHSDSAAAEGIANRQGLGMVRHLDTRFFWLQDQVKANRLVIKHIPGNVIPADIFTKLPDQTQIIRHHAKMGFAIVEAGSRLHRVLEAIEDLPAGR
ncbi:unnamed protein product, partial [Prorocentrum cordatum]